MELLEPIIVALKKIPFAAYLGRLWKLAIDPSIKQDDLSKNDLRFAFLDVIFALGFVAAVFGLVFLIKPELLPGRLILIFNPIYLAILILSYGLVFSIVLSLSEVLMAKVLQWRNTKLAFQKMYFLFLHCMRIFGVLVLFLGFMCVAWAELALNALITLQTSSVSTFPIIQYLLLPPIIFYLLIVPASDFIPLSKNKHLSRAITIIIVFASSHSVLYPSSFVSPKIIDWEKALNIAEDVLVH